MAPLLSWRPEYSVNEAELDSDNIKLFEILNTVYENVMNSLEVDCVLPIIDELSQHTRYHFTAEEQHMREKKFHVVDAHVTKHREFTHKIETLKAQYNGNNLEVAKELIILLGNWLLSHVLTEDKKYSLESELNTITGNQHNIHHSTLPDPITLAPLQQHTLTSTMLSHS